jgi:hypothetical protein
MASTMMASDETCLQCILWWSKEVGRPKTEVGRKNEEERSKKAEAGSGIYSGLPTSDFKLQTKKILHN